MVGQLVLKMWVNGIYWDDCSCVRKLRATYAIFRHKVELSEMLTEVLQDCCDIELML